jgi:transposase
VSTEGRAVAVMSCYEAGYEGFWLHRQLEAHGVRNYVIDPASLQVDRRARTANDLLERGQAAHELVATLAQGRGWRSLLLHRTESHQCPIDFRGHALASTIESQSRACGNAATNLHAAECAASNRASNESG